MYVSSSLTPICHKAGYLISRTRFVKGMRQCLAACQRYARAALACAFLSVAAAFPASAECIPDVALVTYSRTVTSQFISEPDRPLFSAPTGLIRFNCSRSGDVDVFPSFSGMRYVRHINGNPAYETAPDSPLVTLRLRLYQYDEFGDPVEGVDPPALDANRRLPLYLQKGHALIQISLEVFARGGAMRPASQRQVGSVFIGNQNVAEFRFDLGYDFLGSTCTLTDARVLLDTIAADLLAQHATAGEKAFSVGMDCGPVSGRPVALEISDAHDRSSTSDVLRATPESSARGVGMQLLYGGQPLRMGTVWGHSLSTGAPERIPFSARYIRTSEDLTPGSINAEAVLTANYY